MSAEEPSRVEILAGIYGLRREPGETDEDLARKVERFIDARVEKVRE